MSKKKLVFKNIKNLKFAVKSELGYDEPVDLSYAKSISLDADYTEQKVYGDGQVLTVLASDKGLTGTLTLVAPSEEYEIAMKRAKKIAGGLATIETKGTVEHALYFETDVINNGVAEVWKTWLLGVVSGKPSQSHSQDEDSPSISEVSHSLTISGTTLLNADGTSAFVENGNTFKVTKLVSTPSDEGYSDFETAVPAVKVAS